MSGPAEFGFSWLLAFMFFLSIALGALFLVMVHHLSDAGWSVATRRVCEHIAALLSRGWPSCSCRSRFSRNTFIRG